MITLHQYPGVWGLSSLSPFCIKVEVFLKLAKLPYEVKVELNPNKGPKGKMPFIRVENKTISDSTFIVNHLIERFELHHLKASDPASLSMKHMVEESLYFILLHSRWIEGDSFKHLQKDFIPLFPKYLGRPALQLIRYNLLKQSRAQGIGRHSQAEINQMASDMIHALSEHLGSQYYFSGEDPTALDATVYSFLVTILKQPFRTFLKEEVSEYTNLIEYVKRMDLELMVSPSSIASPT